MPRLLVLAAAFAVALPVSAQTTDQWRADLRLLAVQLPVQHREAFAKMTRAQWDSAVASIDTRIPTLPRHAIVAEFIALVAMVRDGHTAITPEAEPGVAFHRLPIRLHDFRDGIFVLRADSANRNLLGAKVVAIGGVPAADALARTARLISHESANWARIRGTSLLTVPDVLAALGLSNDTLSATFTVEINERRQDVRLRAVNGTMPSAATGTAGMLELGGDSNAPEPLWQQVPDRVFWFRVLPDSTLYINYREVAFFAHGMLNETFFRTAFAAGDSAGVKRLVIDLRTNSGGNNTVNRALVREIVKRPALDQPNNALVLISRNVFSAAQNLVNELDYMTNATFIGEPTGNAPNQYGDARPFQLPNSGIGLRISTLLWQGHSAGDQRTWFEPDIYVEPTAADYRARRDVVLETALRRATGPSLGTQLRAVGITDTTSARQFIVSYRDNAENRYRNVRRDFVSAGYEVLRANEAQLALNIFLAASTLYPAGSDAVEGSASAYERLGNRDAAIAAYRRALSMDPRALGSRDALIRLGVTP